MSLTLSFLFIRLIANVRGPHGLAGIMQSLWGSVLVYVSPCGPRTLAISRMK